MTMKRRISGPVTAPPGHITVYRFETKEQHAFRERCRLAGNAERQARDAITEARWGGGEKRRPDSHPKVRAALKAYRAAARELEACQARCAHPSRSIFSPVHCDVCHEHVECDVENYRRHVALVGARAASRLAI